jgi:hypothetical protein
MGGNSDMGEMEFTDTLFVGAFFLFALAASYVSIWPKIEKYIGARKCHNCGRLWAAQTLNEQLLGVFRKSHPLSDMYRTSMFDSKTKMAMYEKYKVNVRCKYCGHEWSYETARKL